MAKSNEGGTFLVLWQCQSSQSCISPAVSKHSFKGRQGPGLRYTCPPYDIDKSFNLHELNIETSSVSLLPVDLIAATRRSYHRILPCLVGKPNCQVSTSGIMSLLNTRTLAIWTKTNDPEHHLSHKYINQELINGFHICKANRTTIKNDLLPALRVIHSEDATFNCDPGEIYDFWRGQDRPHAR